MEDKPTNKSATARTRIRDQEKAEETRRGEQRRLDTPSTNAATRQYYRGERARSRGATPDTQEEKNISASSSN
jgi:hypothetical protein